MPLNLCVYNFFSLSLAAEYLDGSETAAAFGSGSGKIWLDDVKCSGDENNILSCPQTSFTRKHNCKNTEDTGVRCPGT